jgi:hypothetical protein
MGNVLRHSARISFEILNVRAVGDTGMARTYTLVLDSIAVIRITEVLIPGGSRWSAEESFRQIFLIGGTNADFFKITGHAAIVGVDFFKGAQKILSANA